MIDVKLSKPADVLALRHQLLRPNQTIADCEYSSDHDVLARHFSAYHDNTQIGIVSVYQEVLKHVPGEDNLSCFENTIGWRIRGIAVLPEYRMRRVGQQLMMALKHYVWDRSEPHNHYIWCNARVVAMDFYKHQGFKAIGEEFELAGIGPHFVMYHPRSLK